MHKKRVAGISLIVLSGLVALSGPRLTGAIIGTQGFTYFSFISLGLFAAGVFLLFSRKNLAIVTDQVFSERFLSTEPSSEKRSPILDTSVIIDFYPEEAKAYLQKIQNSRGEVYIPESVFKEIHDPDEGRHNPEMIRALKESGAVETTEFEKYQGESEAYLQRTTKALLYKKVSPFIQATLGIGKPIETTRRDAAKIKKDLLPTLLSRAEKDNFYIPPQQGGKERRFYEKCNEYLERHCKVSGADIDVLASAIDEARYGNHAVVGEKDKDLREAIDFIKKDDPETGKLIDYVETYKAKQAS